MSPETALDTQIELYRAVTGEQRLAIALRLQAILQAVKTKPKTT